MKPSDRHRPSARQRGYTKRWERARAAWLAEHPLCVRCEAQGKLVTATVVDHIVPHKGDPVKFWDSEDNWQSLCMRHHNAKTMEETHGRVKPIIGVDGWPIDGSS